MCCFVVDSSICSSDIVHTMSLAIPCYILHAISVFVSWTSDESSALIKTVKCTTHESSGGLFGFSWPRFWTSRQHFHLWKQDRVVSACECCETTCRFKGNETWLSVGLIMMFPGAWYQGSPSTWTGSSDLSLMLICKHKQNTSYWTQRN
jgi:hypothetical protein